MLLLFASIIKSVSLCHKVCLEDETITLTIKGLNNLIV